MEIHAVESRRLVSKPTPYQQRTDYPNQSAFVGRAAEQPILQPHPALSPPSQTTSTVSEDSFEPPMAVALPNVVPSVGNRSTAAEIDAHNTVKQCSFTLLMGVAMVERPLSNPSVPAEYREAETHAAS